MKVPVQITFRGFSRSQAVANNVRKKAEKLGLFFDKVLRVRVVLEASHRRHHKGNLYHAQITVTVPGNKIVVGRDPAENMAHTDLYVAVRDGFSAARRQLQEYAARVHGKVKRRDGGPIGVVIKLFPDEGFGFLQTIDGREVFFHRNSVLRKGFDRLKIGSKVIFSEEQGIKGVQASTVRVAS